MSSVKRKIAFSTFYQFFGKIASTALGLFSIALITRHLGVDGYGQYATAITFVGIFSIIADMGLYIYVVREISKERANSDHIVSNVFTLRITSAVILLSLAPIVALLFPYDQIIWYAILLATLSFFFISLNQILIGVFQRRFDTRIVAVAEIVGRFALIALLFVAIWLGLGLLAIIVCVVAGSFVNFLIVYLAARRHVKIRLRFDFAFWKEILKVTWPIAISVVLNVIYFKVDTIFLSVMKPGRDVGLYGEAYKILEVLIAFPAMFAGLVMPLLSLSAFKDWQKFKRVIDKGFDVMSMAALPVVVAGIILAEPIVVFIGGPEFAPAAPILQILVLATASIFIGNLFANAVVAINKQRQMVWAYLGTAALAVALDWLLIPQFTYIGAAWATVATEVLIAGFSIWMVWKTSGALPSMRNLGKVFVAGAAMAVAIWGGATWFDWQIPWWWLLTLLVVGLAVYVGVLFGIGGVKRQELKEILQRR
ncbi:flippase [Patescibacteria group bacterium]